MNTLAIIAVIVLSTTGLKASGNEVAIESIISKADAKKAIGEHQAIKVSNGR